jgi:hypothetical protein
MKGLLGGHPTPRILYEGYLPAHSHALQIYTVCNCSQPPCACPAGHAAVGKRSQQVCTRHTHGCTHAFITSPMKMSCLIGRTRRSSPLNCY